MKAEITEMEKIVASLLEAERLSGRHARLNRTEVKVAGLVEELIDDFFSRDRDRIDIDLPTETVFANLDEARISLLLKNLLSNALRYSSPDDGPIRLSFRTEGDDLVFRVADSGPGLSADQAAHLGEPFYRADPSRTRDSGGTGLGLYLATLVANAHRGTLELVDQDSRGATFELRLPRMA
jgi:signal transduction histidine kinase